MKASAGRRYCKSRHYTYFAIRLASHRSLLPRNPCSHMRRTRQPRRRSSRFTSLSRLRFASILFCQNSLLLTGTLACFGQPCQKQPSTKTATRCLRKTKSGLPNTGWFRRQPVIRFRRINAISANSVVLLPRDRMRAITCDRFAGVKMSVSDVIQRFDITKQNLLHRRETHPGIEVPT